MEDKFDDLELNHILRHLNEVSDALAKAASGREPVPMGIFTSDQHKPSVHYEGLEQGSDGSSNPGPGVDQPSATSGPKVMELKEDLATEPNPLVDWRTLYLDYLLLRHCQRTRWRLDGSHITPSPLFLWRMNSTSEATLGSYSAASPLNRGSIC